MPQLTKKKALLVPSFLVIAAMSVSAPLAAPTHAQQAGNPVDPPTPVDDCDCLDELEAQLEAVRALRECADDWEAIAGQIYDDFMSCVFDAGNYIDAIIDCHNTYSGLYNEALDNARQYDDWADEAEDNGWDEYWRCTGECPA